MRIFMHFNGDLRMQKFTECIRTCNNNNKLVLSCLGIEYTNFIAKFYRLFCWDKSVIYMGYTKTFECFLDS